MDVVRRHDDTIGRINLHMTLYDRAGRDPRMSIA